VEIRAKDHVLVCDAGTGIIPFGHEIVKQKDVRELMVILTHYHWDHVCGLPFFLPAFSPEWKINFFAPGEDTAEIEQHFADQMRSPYFPVGTETWLADIKYLAPQNNGFDHGPIKIQYSNVHHPGITYGYRIQLNGKSILYVSDNECKFMEKSVSKRTSELNEEERALYEEMVKEEHQTELEFIKDADILIHDAQYNLEDYEKKHGWGHSCYIDTVNTAIDAGVKALYLYHHDPTYDDETINKIHNHAKEIVKERNSSLQCHIAREGMCIDL
jgi:phosphoribosyl 1,2-cyclic phosphodiesterase